MRISPVIHIKNWDQVDANLKICQENGIDFVFLINHYNSSNSNFMLEKMFYNTKEKYPDMAVGLNFLQLDTVDAFHYIEKMKVEHPYWHSTQGVDAIWADRAYIAKDTLDKAEEILGANKGAMYFGGVAFKYQKQPKPEELEWVCKTACKYMNVITTSGPGTGEAADIKKIELIRSYIGDHPLAIASGLSPENKSQFDGLVDWGLVASSITDPYTETINESRLKQLLK